MCGIVGAIAERNVVPILLEGLRRLEYRGYDSAGVAIFTNKKVFERVRSTGKVKNLVEALQANPLKGNLGVAHTRWATHGTPTENNAHPHMSNNEIVLVHNGIIENYLKLRDELMQQGYEFTTETDTEVIAHLIHKHFAQKHDILQATQAAVKQLTGAFALAIIAKSDPARIIASRKGSPLVIGVGIEENFVASDYMALLPVTQNFIYLEDGDCAEVYLDKINIYDVSGKQVSRKTHVCNVTDDVSDCGKYKHYMQKEIFSQPDTILNALEGRFTEDGIIVDMLAKGLSNTLPKIENVQIVACGTSYHAGLVAKYWFEELADLPCQVEIASEIRYRKVKVKPNTLFIAISQSGETADTLAALREAKKIGYASTLAICNVPESSLVRESDMAIMTYAGPEIGVASTKAFTTQLTTLLMLVLGFKGKTETTKDLIGELKKMSGLISEVLRHDEAIMEIAKEFINKGDAIYLGRGKLYPVALEGALKLKEISYIHAEGYPAGELKHGPLALIDKNMPVIVIAPSNYLFDKILSNIHEVKARGGRIFVFSDDKELLAKDGDIKVFAMPKVAKETASIIYTVPLQLLAYHVAVLKGTDVDHPRNLAKSVTVE
jgi:glucosamine--fructose-6-phosphate aminotransferase (isomerizing)